MKLKEHFLISLGVSIPLVFYWNEWRAGLFLSSAVLIDADHYWDYLWKNKFADWSGWRMFRYYDWLNGHFMEKRYLAFSLLHTAEVFILAYLLARFWYYDFFMTIFWGMLFHLMIDVVDLAYRGRPFIRPYSITEYLIRKNILLRKGINPTPLFQEAFAASKKST